jgi:FlaA1/EpsC-like NDP-sugar epimerase
MRNRYVLLGDLPAIGLAAFAAFALRFDLFFVSYRPEFPRFLLAALIVKPLVFFPFGMYRRYWRYGNIDDVLMIMLSNAAASVGLAVVVAAGLFAGMMPGVSRTVVLIDGLMTLLLTGGLRLAIRVVGENRTRSLEKRRTGDSRVDRRVLVVGAGDAGTIVVRELQRNPHLGMDPVGFLDDNPAKLGKRIYGLPVLGTLASLGRIAPIERVEEVIIAMPTASGDVVRSIADTCRDLGLRSRTMPGVYELLDGQLSVSRLRQVEIADLLRRSQIRAKVNDQSYIGGRRVVVTGAGGSIGRELCRQVAHERPASLTLVGHGENSIFDTQMELLERFPGLSIAAVIADIRHADHLGQVFGRVRPEIVFHAAAHKHVPLMEDNPEEAISNNVGGTQNVLNAAIAAGSERFVMISTDKAVAPGSLMGASKRIAEEIVRAAARRTGRPYVTVRFGNVLGSRGSVVPLFKRQIEQGGPVTVTDPEMRRFFMTIPEAVHLVMQAGGIGRSAELFVLNMGEPIKVVDLARDLITLSGFSLDDIPITFTGVRPGEKLEEMLWEPGAAVDPTGHPEILSVREAEVCKPEDLAGLVAQLLRAAQSGDRLGIDALLAQALPTFVPACVRAPWAPATKSPEAQ